MTDILIAFAAGLALTALTAYFLGKRIVKSHRAQLEQQVKMQAENTFKIEQARLESDLEHAKERARDLEAQLAAAREESARQEQAWKAETESVRLRTKDEDARLLESTKAELRQRNQEALEKVEETHRQAMTALQQRFDETIAKVQAEMQAKTEEILKARQKEFSEMSGARIGQLVNPLAEDIAELKKAMAEGSKELAERNGEMKQQIKDLMAYSDASRKCTEELTAAFRHSGKVQGDWGETVLEELLSSQGLTNGIHFHTQAAITSDLRPDVVLHLDSRREVIIDSKVSLTAYLKYVNADHEDARKAFLKEHLESIRKHWKELAKKDYASHIKAPKVTAGYVIMFVPVAGAFWSALNEEPGLWREAAANNVYITDEMSLFTVLKMVKLTWTQISQAQNHEEVFKLANELVERVGMFMKHYDAIGDALKSATESFDNGRKKLLPTGQSILTTTGKLVKLGAKNEGKYQIRELQDVSEIPALPAETPESR
ncbi:MAG: DNA recombination protein RmuC [Bacteroidales bacterium]|nr:DNA recombination protein RmuC [Bacteroidales bacterium]